MFSSKRIISVNTLYDFLTAASDAVVKKPEPVVPFKIEKPSCNVCDDIGRSLESTKTRVINPERKRDRAELKVKKEREQAHINYFQERSELLKSNLEELFARAHALLKDGVILGTSDAETHLVCHYDISTINFQKSQHFHHNTPLREKHLKEAWDHAYQFVRFYQKVKKGGIPDVSSKAETDPKNADIIDRLYLLSGKHIHAILIYKVACLNESTLEHRQEKLKAINDVISFLKDNFRFKDNHRAWIILNQNKSIVHFANKEIDQGFTCLEAMVDIIGEYDNSLSSGWNNEEDYKKNRSNCNLYNASILHSLL